MELQSMFSFKLFPNSARWAPLALRLMIGFGFMEHGFAKLSHGPEAFAAILQAMSVPAPHLMAWLTILTEIGGGLAVFLGALVPLVSIPMAAVLLVAMFTVHLPYGFSSIKLLAVTAAGARFGPPGFETDLLYLACLAALVLGGSGPLTIDGFLAKRRKITGTSSNAEPSAGGRGAGPTNRSEAPGRSGQKPCLRPDAAVACGDASFALAAARPDGCASGPFRWFKRSS